MFLSQVGMLVLSDKREIQGQSRERFQGPGMIGRRMRSTVSDFLDPSGNKE